jgi:CRISPR-associated protein Cas5t
MIYLVVEIRTVTSTFRDSEFQNFHKTLNLPPPTTLVGLAGAALGESPKGAQEWFEKDDWEIGIFGTSEGFTKDLWKYRTLSTDPQKASSVLLREILFDNHFFVVFGCQDDERVNFLLQAFNYPKYALSLGNSDSLAKVVTAQIVKKTDESRDLTHCLTSGNVLNQVRDNFSNGEEFSIYSSSEPIAYDLPTRFQYVSDYGVRRIVHRKTLSFIGERMQLNFAVPGIWFKNKFIPVFSLYDKTHSKSDK